jgi:hypothetical protein
MALILVTTGLVSGPADVPPNARSDDKPFLINTGKLSYAEEATLADGSVYVVATFVDAPISVILFDQTLDKLRAVDPRLAVVWTADVTSPDDAPPDARVKSKRCLVGLDHITYAETFSLASTEVYVAAYLHGSDRVVDIFEQTLESIVALSKGT